MDLGEDVTRWLRLWREGDDEAVSRVTDIVYQDLRRLAGYYLSGESKADILQPTSLVHDAYLRIASVREVDWKGRGQFIAVIAQMMRRILVDHARSRNALKRELTPQNLEPSPSRTARIDILAVDQALDRLNKHYPRCAQVVELRFFGGLEFPEIAQSLDISLTTVERDWRFSRAWLHEKLAEPRGDN